MKIKKVLFFLIILLGIILLSNVSNASVGSEFTYNNIKYTVLAEETNNYTVEVSGYEGNLREVTIPQTVLNDANTYTVTEIGENAFRDNFSLKSIIMPNTITVIKKSAFEKCEAMENIKMSTALTTIGEYAFCGCKSLTSIIIPNSVKVIKELAFSYATSLENVTLSNSLTTIEHGVFQDCSSLKIITIPASVTLIGDGVFAWCPKLQEINVIGGNTEYCSVDGILFNYDKTKLICYPASKQGTSYTIPSSVISIESFAFKACSLLKEIDIPNSVTTIKSSAFDECTSLTSITIPDSITTIEPYTFVWCSNLNRINFPASVTTIVDDSAFWGCDYLTFFCNDGSYAKEYAQNNNINCKPLYYYSVINNVSNVSIDGPFYTHQEEGDYITILKEHDGYKLPTEITVKVGNKTLNTTEYEYNNTSGKLVIPALNITGDITIEGDGIEIYKVIFDANGGFFIENRTTYIVDDWEIGDEKTLENPTRDGYKFLGFFTEKTGGTKLENYIAESGIDNDLIFYARWEENSSAVPPNSNEEGRLDDNDSNTENTDTSNTNTSNTNTSANNNNISTGNNPQTSDNIILFVAILGISIIGITITTIIRKKLKNK